MDYSKYTILIVDDVPLNIVLVKKLLERFAFNYRSANNGKAALQSICEQRPDIVLLDIMMPVMDGYEALKAIRNDPEMKDLRVVFLSALNSEVEVLKGLEAGANDFITKPILVERLVSCIENQISEIEG